MDDRALDELLDSLTPPAGAGFAWTGRCSMPSKKRSPSTWTDSTQISTSPIPARTTQPRRSCRGKRTRLGRAVPLRKKGPAIAAALAAAAVLLILAWPRAETPDTGDMALLAEGEAPEPLPEEALEARALLLKLKLSRLRKLASATPKCERYRTDLISARAGTGPHGPALSRVLVDGARRRSHRNLQARRKAR